MKMQRGFTLVELLMVVVITAILLTLAVPSFTSIIQSSNISNGVNTFMADLRFTRSEAIRRGGMVVMCRSDAPEAANPVCGTGTGPGGNGWVSGWIVFIDDDNDGAHDAAETVLRVQSGITSLDSIVEDGSSSSTLFRFAPTGRMLNLSSATSMQFGGSNYANNVQRMVCVNLGGRARIAGDGNSACSTDR